MSTPGKVFGLVAALAIVLPGAGVWWGTSLVHHAVARRAAAGNTATAQAVSAQVGRTYDDRLAAAQNLLVLVSNGAKLDGSLADRGRLSSPFCRITFLNASGSTVTAVPLASCVGQPVPARVLTPAADVVQLPPVVANGAGTASLVFRLNAGERRAIGRQARWLQVQFGTTGLMSPVRVGRTGSYGLVDARTGVILSTRNASTIGRELASPAARRLVQTGRAGVLQVYAPRMRTTVLTAYRPIAGTPFGVFISLPAAEAFADADHVRDVLLAGFALLLALGLAVAAIVAVLLGRRDRKLRDQMEQLHKLATTDALTGLANRSRLVEVLDTTLTLVDRGSLKGFAVVFLDLDGVKSLNDTAGHGTTDRLLVAIAASLRTELRPADTMARIGGDEFVLLAPGVADIRQAEALGDRLCALVRECQLRASDGSTIGLTASAGVTVTTVDQPPRSAAELLRQADEAMYRVKRQGGNAAELATHPSG